MDIHIYFFKDTIFRLGLAIFFAGINYKSFKTVNDKKYCHVMSLQRFRSCVQALVSRN